MNAGPTAPGNGLTQVKNTDAEGEHPEERLLSSRRFRTIVIGASAGGMKALGKWVSLLPADFSKIVVIAQHLYPQSDSTIYQYLDRMGCLTVKEAQEKETTSPGVVYTAPPNYHLLVEQNGTFSLSVDEKVNYSRPSIDVLFESAARVWRRRLIGIILTGANDDGARGLGVIKHFGGMTIAQDPATAEFPVMPQAAIDLGVVDMVMTIEEMGAWLGKA